MMTDLSARLALPLLQPGQSQKEMYHNEALAMLDLAVQADVEAVGLNVPPADPAIGKCWIVGTAPTGAWSGLANHLAGWTAGGWRFVAPRAGFTVWSRADAVFTRFSDGAWAVGVLAGNRVEINGTQLLGAQADAIMNPVGGSIVDSESRSSILAILTAMRDHGLIAT